jgi:hypothetical protein
MRETDHERGSEGDPIARRLRKNYIVLGRRTLRQGTAEEGRGGPERI